MADNMDDKQFEEYIEEARKKTPVADPEFDNFLGRVDSIAAIVKGLASKDASVSERANRQAEIYLHTKDDVDERDCTVRLDKTSINRKAFEAGPVKKNGTETMNPDAFMAHCEKDAWQRSEDKRQRTAIADAYKRRGNEAFRRGELEKAYSLYSKAIDEIRDSGVLYTNRALCCLHLRVHQRALSDCEWALKVNDNNLKAWLYKAKAHHRLGEQQQASECLEEAEKRHPTRLEEIREYGSQFGPPGTQEEN